MEMAANMPSSQKMVLKEHGFGRAVKNPIIFRLLKFSTTNSSTFGYLYPPVILSRFKRILPQILS